MQINRALHGTSCQLLFGDRILSCHRGVYFPILHNRIFLSLEARGLSSVAAGSYHLRANSLCSQCEVGTKDGPPGTSLLSGQGTKMGAVVQAEMGVTSVVVPGQAT